jgi:hypothetical protein
MSLPIIAARWIEWINKKATADPSPAAQDDSAFEWRYMRRIGILGGIVAYPDTPPVCAARDRREVKSQVRASLKWLADMRARHAYPASQAFVRAQVPIMARLENPACG